MDDDDSYCYGMLLEEMREQNRVVMEALGAIRWATLLLPEVRQRVVKLEDDMEVVKATITDTSR
jgi:hypothetical protein